MGVTEYLGQWPDGKARGAGVVATVAEPEVAFNSFTVSGFSTTPARSDC